MSTPEELTVAYHTTVREMPSDERPRERLKRYGASTLQSTELLAIILRVGTPQENVIELASRLLRQCGGLGGLLAMDFADLCGMHGLGVAKAAQLKAALELGRRVIDAPPDARPQITSPDDIARLVMGEMGFLTQEQLRVLCLNTKHFLVHQQIVYLGTVNGSSLRVAEIFKPAISHACPAIVVAHNHPSGDPTPSDEDIRTTHLLRQAGELLDIELLDHVIVGHNKHISLKQLGLGF